MIVISLVLVIAAAVSLFIGLFLSETLTFIWAAIVLCLVSLALLWLGTRQRKSAAPTEPSAPVYGGAARGGATTPARPAATDDRDQASSSDEDEDRDADTAAEEVAADRSATGVASTPSTTAPPRKVPVKKATTRRPVAKKATVRKATSPGSDRQASETTRAQARARLAQIAGVGPSQQDALLERYGSLDGIREASVDDLVANVRGVDEALATRIKNRLG